MIYYWLATTKPKDYNSSLYTRSVSLSAVQIDYANRQICSPIFKLPLLKNQCYFPLKEMQGLILEFMINCNFKTALTLADRQLGSRKLKLKLFVRFPIKNFHKQNVKSDTFQNSNRQ